MKQEKTDVMRILDSKNIKYQEYFYGNTPAISGIEVAKVLNEDERKVFKTLVTKAKSQKNYVFMIPVGEELDFKKCAKSVGEKSIEMVLQKELFPLTGYVHGGCSPIGLKKPFKVIIDSSAQNFSSIIFSGGKIGYQVEVYLNDLAKAINYQFAEVAKDKENINE